VRRDGTTVTLHRSVDAVSGALADDRASMHIPDLSTKTYREEAHKGVYAVSVGWLGKKVTSRGKVAPEIMEMLRHCRKECYREDGYLGYHTCEICGRAEFHGEFWIEVGCIRYVLPVGVLHYIEVHGYCPPTEFLTDIEEIMNDGRRLG
jgi:hypothetical protein